MQVSMSDASQVKQRLERLNMYKQKRLHLHKRVRKTVIGSTERPRLSVYRSGQHIYAQIIDDSKGVTLLSVSDLKEAAGTKKERAVKVGESIAKAALGVKVKAVVFDRGGMRYHGRVAALAEGARKGGLEF